MSFSSPKHGDGDDRGIDGGNQGLHKKRPLPKMAIVVLVNVVNR